MNFSVVRAADTALGNAFAMELARQKRHLILIGKDAQKLKRLSLITAESGIRVFYFQQHDALPNGIAQLCERINGHYDVDLLINLGNTDSGVALADCGFAELNRALADSIEAGPLFVHQLLPNLLRQYGASVLQISCSVSGALGVAALAFDDQFVSSFNEEMFDAGYDLRAFHVKLSKAICGLASADPVYWEDIASKILTGFFREETVSVVAD